MAGQDIPRPFAFDPKQITKMLDWAAQRIVEGPDPKAGARSFVELDPDLAGSITDDGIGAGHRTNLSPCSQQTRTG